MMKPNVILNKIKEYLFRIPNTKKGKAMIVLFVLMLVLNCLSVPTMDDLGYQINNGFIDILYREYVQYMTWTGRTTAHLIARTFLALPKIIFNICNSLCFVHLCNLITSHAERRKDNDNWQIFTLSALMIFLFAPLFGQTCLWETGSCNYLWTTTIVMHFLLNYRLAEAEETADHSWFLMLLAGIPAGWTNENTGGALILMILFFIFLGYLRKNIKLWMLTGLAGSMIGFIMLLIAPGNKVRALDFVSSNGKAYDLIHDFYGMLEVFEDGQIWIWIMFAVGIGILLTQKHSSDTIRTSLAYAFAGAAAVGAIILSPVPVLYDRSMFGASVFLITAVMTAFSAVEISDLNQKMISAVMMIMLVISGFHYVRAAADLTYTCYQYRNREAYVKSQKNLGNLNPTVPLIYDEFMTSYNPMFGLGDISYYRLLWANQYYAQVHGIESVQATSLQKWTDIYKNGSPELMNITDMQKYLETVSEKGYTLLINSSSIDSDVYEKEISILKNTLGLNVEKEGILHVAAVYKNGRFVQKSISEDGVEAEGNMDCGAYYYISSNDNVYYSDIVVNGIEYTNDNEGITVVVVDENQNRVVDSVTWYPWSDQGGIRYYVEK